MARNDKRDALKLVKQLQRVGILTGSRRFGVASSRKSDYDYLLTNQMWRKYFEDYIGLITYDGEDYDEPDFRSFKLIVGNRTYNLLVLHTKEEFLVWKKATEFMANLPKWLLEDKTTRVYIFDAAKQAARHGEIVLEAT